MLGEDEKMIQEKFDTDILNGGWVTGETDCSSLCAHLAPALQECFKTKMFGIHYLFIHYKSRIAVAILDL